MSPVSDERLIIQQVLGEVTHVGTFGATEFTELLHREVLGMPDTFSKLVSLVAKAYDREINYSALNKFNAAATFMTFAAQTFDDIVDADKDTSLVSRVGVSQALLLGLGSWFIAQTQLNQAFSLAHANSPEVAHWLKSVSETYTTIVHSAFLELNQPNARIMVVEQCLAQAAASTGLYFELLFEGVGLLSGAPPLLTEKYAHFGYKAGTLYQLKNDLVGYLTKTTSRNNQGSQKITLPDAYVLEVTAAPESQPLVKTVVASPADVKPLEAALPQSGEILSTLLTMQQIYSQLVTLLNPPNEYDLELLKVVKGWLNWGDSAKGKEGGSNSNEI